MEIIDNTIAVNNSAVEDISNKTYLERVYWQMFNKFRQTFHC